ncbi:C3 and PZP-like alpha-2-macroglobulin domain-containing protein 8, partial [Varanus komodoensis]|uniref:C3 and PZP-like alpha-2-macroglobulin domain-containing protein 8 n=1 Tax=Varanus komodoensis TaxID=61221 RepID=UPI001CF7778B
LPQPEGLPRQYTYSVFFCPNEQIHISTPNKYEYQYVRKPTRMTRFDVAIKAHHSAHIVLSSAPHDVAEATEIVIGGLQNTRTWISAGRMGDPVASEKTFGILSWHEFQTFWISWADGLIQVGHGPPAPGEAVIVSWAAPRRQDPKYVGFSTGWGSAGEFKIWRKEEAEENHNEAFTLGVPHNMVPGSERATASVIGDVVGPALGNLGHLLQLPLGCGEQNMVHFAPNVFVLKYLQKTQQLEQEVEREATDFLLQGYQRQLTYRRRDGSYSAFGQRDSSGSMWLTAFVLKSFAQARGFIYIDPKELLAAKEWIVRQQGDDGSFPAVGSVLNKDIQGGIHGRIALTAFVVVALLEAGVSSEAEKASVAQARRFLESGVPSSGDPYTIVLGAYALTLLHSPAAGPALRKMNSAALTQDSLTHWGLSRPAAADLDAFLGFDDGPPQSAASAEVEMTAYALLTLTLLGDVASALPVVKWLSQQRNALGGFSSTQDTCVALQALAEYAILSYLGGVNLTVSVASTNLDYQETFELNRANKKILQKAVIPSIPTGLFVSAKGEGCCLLQIDVSYNVPEPLAKPAFQLLVGLREPVGAPRSRRAARARKHASPGGAGRERGSPAEREDRVTVEACVRWLRPGSSNMAVLEVPLLSGFQADVGSLEQLLLNPPPGLKRYELSGRKVLFYFDEIPSRCLTCVAFGALRRHLVGQTAPLPARVYDYYEPSFEAARFYNLSRGGALAGELCGGPPCNEVGGAGGPRDGFLPISPCNSADDGPMCPNRRNDTRVPAGPCATGGGPSVPPEASDYDEYEGDPLEAAPASGPPAA